MPRLSPEWRYSVRQRQEMRLVVGLAATNFVSRLDLRTTSLRGNACLALVQLQDSLLNCHMNSERSGIVEV